MKTGTTVALVTFGLFMAQAIMHYNMGRKSETDLPSFMFPPGKDMGRLAITVGVFSILNGVIIKALTK